MNWKVTFSAVLNNAAASLNINNEIKSGMKSCF